MFLLLLAVFCVTIWICYKRWEKKNHSYWPSRNVPFFNRSALFSFWDLFQFKYGLHEIESMVYKGIEKQGFKDYAGVAEFATPALYIMDPDLIKTVLVKDFDSFVDRRAFNVEKTDPLFAKMLVNAKGQPWKDLRSTMSPTFTTGKIRRMYSIFNDSSDKLSDFLKSRIQNGNNEMELQDALSRYTASVISSTAFGLDSQSFSEIESDFSKYAKKFQNQFSGIGALRLFGVMVFPKLCSMLGISVLDQDAANFFAQVIRNTIKHRESTGEKRDDFLQLLMESRNGVTESIPLTSDEFSSFEKEAQIDSPHSKVQMTEEEILAQCLLFFLGGFDTVETMLTMTAYELALNPEVQEKLHGELQEASEENNGKLNYDLIMKSEYLDQVASETMRKWPPGFRLERKATKAYRIPNSDAIIENDTMIVISAYGLHMDEKYFPNPVKFDPERFTAENKGKINPYTYLPFGAGPRNCIAMRFALAEAKAAIAHLILNFKLEPSGKTEIPMKFKPMVAFKPANGLWLRVTSRN